MNYLKENIKNENEKNVYTVRMSEQKYNHADQDRSRIVLSCRVLPFQCALGHTSREQHRFHTTARAPAMMYKHVFTAALFPDAETRTEKVARLIEFLIVFAAAVDIWSDDDRHCCCGRIYACARVLLFRPAGVNQRGGYTRSSCVFVRAIVR